MTSTIEQMQYSELYFDLERTRNGLLAIKDLVESTSESLTQVYVNEQEMLAKGEPVPDRIPLDVAIRAGLSSSVALLYPQLLQMLHSLQHGQMACKLMCPFLEPAEKSVLH